MPCEWLLKRKLSPQKARLAVRCWRVVVHRYTCEHIHRGTQVHRCTCTRTQVQAEYLYCGWQGQSVIQAQVGQPVEDEEPAHGDVLRVVHEGAAVTTASQHLGQQADTG